MNISDLILALPNLAALILVLEMRGDVKAIKDRLGIHDRKIRFLFRKVKSHG